MTPQSKTEHLKISNTEYHAKRLRVGVIFGGRSVEHEVSLVSAASGPERPRSETVRSDSYRHCRRWTLA